jgi:ergothioneine biosynthesis protein EgtB
MSAQLHLRNDASASDQDLSGYQRVRGATTALCAPLTPEDAVAQSMPDASPAKWHLAHTTWFFERFLLAHFRDDYRAPHPDWDYLFNSYYQSAGPRYPRPQRGMLTRPALDEVLDWRAHVDAAMQDLIAARGGDPALRGRLELGLNHEQQHQELLLTDIKHLFSLNPLYPAYSMQRAPRAGGAIPLQWLPGRAGITEVGHAGDGFAFDNETPRHRVLLHPHAIANRCVTNGEYLEFIRDGGYRQPLLWLADGWDTVQREGWRHPLYWFDDLESMFTLSGRCAIDPGAPVCHVSFFEADAFARWAGARLPIESEWEAMAAGLPPDGHFADSNVLQPRPAADRDGGTGAPLQMFGDVWEWTASPYVGYPGYRPLAGTLGEYNGKFMSGQWVLRGGSCVTPARHVRASYRNFFQPAARWQFCGLRLARDP